MTLHSAGDPLGPEIPGSQADGLRLSIVARVYANLAKIMSGKAAAGLISVAYMVIAVRVLGARDYGILILVHGYTVTVGGIIEFPAGRLLCVMARKLLPPGTAIGWFGCSVWLRWSSYRAELSPSSSPPCSHR